MKKVLTICMAVLLAAVCCLGCGSGKATDAQQAAPAATDAGGEAQAGMPSPIHTCTDLAGLLSAVGGVTMADAPAGASDVSYTYIEGEPVIAQIQFTLDGNDYSYRAVAGLDAGKEIAGVYEGLAKTAEYVVPDGDKLGGSYTLYYDAGQVYGVAAWNYAPTQCSYTLYTPTGCDVSQSVVNVARALLPVTEAAAPEASDQLGIAQSVTVASVGDGQIVVNAEDGSTLQFSTVSLGDPGVRPGDVVDIEYRGDLLDVPEATSVTIVQAYAASTQVSGTVSMFDKKSVFVLASDGMVYGFNIDTNTQYSGQSTTLKNGNTVTITYSGELSGSPLATGIETTAVSAAPVQPTQETDPGDSSLQNKRLAGTVTDYSQGYYVTITTSTGHVFTFGITGNTVISEYYVLEVGARIRVTYDGYASNSPNAKKIQVLSLRQDNPDPSPALYTMEGTLNMYASGYLSISTASGNLQEFTLTGDTRLVNVEYCIQNYPVRVTYYGDEGGYKVATKVVFSTPIVY